MADRLRDDRPAVVAQFLACLGESALLWMLAGALAAAASNGAGRLPGWLPLALLLLATAAPAIAEAVETGPLLGFETVVTALALASLAVTLKVLCAPDLPWRSTAWLRRGVDSLALKPDSGPTTAWLAVALVAVAWWRGRSRAAPSTESSYGLLRLGAPLALAGAALAAVVAGGPSDGAVAWAAVAFLAAALAQIAMARAFGLGGQRVSALAPLDLAIAAAPLFATGLLGLLTVAVVSGDALATLLWAMHPLLWLLMVAVEIVLLAIVVVVYLVVAPIFWLLGRRHFTYHSVRLTTSPFFNDPAKADHTASGHTVPDAIRYVVAAALLALVIAGVRHYVFRRRAELRVVADDAERITLRPAFDLRGLLDTLLGNLRREPAPDPLASLRGDPAWAATLRIREAYTAFLAWSAARGRPRVSGATPREHAGSLARANPTGPSVADLSALTAAYERARYATVPAATADADAADAAWARLRRLPPE